jgi:copper chaperone CopZ
MKNPLIKIMVAIIVLLSTTSNAQIKNTKTETVKIYGNCGMCKTTIEKTGSIKKIATVDWNQETQMATLTYDSKKTNPDEILKRIALAGYDSDKFLAPDDVYNNLHGCCQYERVAKVPAKETIAIATTEGNANHSAPSESASVEVQNENQLKAVFENYFLVKDALIASNATKAASASNEVLNAVNTIKMDQLEMDVHMVWMKVITSIKEEAKKIADSKDINQQRQHFSIVSKDLYGLIKVALYESPIYYQYCPMYDDGTGAHWLSKENAVKNPYYGSKMLTCGKTIETIK